MLYAVGDIHGQAEKLRTVINQLLEQGLSPDDEIVFLGDYIDRGPDSTGVIEQLLAFERDYPKAVFLRGNHEQMMIDARARYDREWRKENNVRFTVESALLWFSNGAIQTLRSYKETATTQGRWWEVVPEDHWRFVLDTELEYKTEHYWFVHAGLLPEGSTWEYAEYDFEPRLWIREPFLQSAMNFGRVVVFGHTPTRNGRPFIMQNKIGLDTGAGWGGPLTAMRVDPDEPFEPNRIRFFSA